MTITTKRRLRASLFFFCAGMLSLGLGVLTTAGLARAMALPAPATFGPPPQSLGELSAERAAPSGHKHQRFSRTNTCGVEVRWVTTPDGWLDVYCREVVLQPPYDAELVAQRHPAVAELRVAGAVYPLHARPDGSLALRVPLTLFGTGETRVHLLAWETSADATDDSQAFLAQGATVRR